MKRENLSLEPHRHMNRKGWKKLFHPTGPDFFSYACIDDPDPELFPVVVCSPWNTNKVACPV